MRFNFKPENKGLHAFHGKISHVASMTFMYYCETHKTVNTRNIYGMLLCCETSANNARDN